MSDLCWKGYDGQDFKPGPSNRKQMKKFFRCKRRIIKQVVMKDGSVTVNGKLPTKVDKNFLITNRADEIRKQRQSDKEAKQLFHECGNKKIKELKNYTVPTQGIYADSNWIKCV